jgi:hypothetical protein
MEMSTGHRQPLLFDALNDKVRVDSFHSLDDHSVGTSLMTFFRQLNAGFVFDEHIAPSMKGGGSTLFTAVRERPWPPWGLGARRVGAVCQVHSVAEASFGISPVFTSDEDRTNIGLITAVYKEALDFIARKQKAEVNYLVIEGAVLADRALRAAGFKRTDDAVVTHDGKYHFYRADAAQLAAHLGLEKAGMPNLLAHELDDQTFERNAYFHLSIATAAGSLVRDWTRRELLTAIAGLFNASLPGGVPPTPPTGPDGFGPAILRNPIDRLRGGGGHGGGGH